MFWMHKTIVMKISLAIYTLSEVSGVSVQVSAFDPKGPPGVRCQHQKYLNFNSINPDTRNLTPDT